MRKLFIALAVKFQAPTLLNKKILSQNKKGRMNSTMGSLFSYFWYYSKS